MQLVRLPGTQLVTTRLGFGTAGLLRVPGRTARLNILAAAFDAGIRHFDTAPIYGLGEAEKVLGTFLAQCRETVTVTTKFGLTLNPSAKRLRLVQSAGRAVLRALPSLRQFARARASTLYEAPAFDPRTARPALEQSLRALKRERADLFLMHECTAAHLTDSSLYECLHGLHEQGLIGAFGSATTYAQTLEVIKAHPELCPVVQCEQYGFGAMDARLSGTQPRGIVTHSVLSHTFASIRRALASDASLATHWSQELDMDARQPQALARLLLQAALASNPNGIVLVHSNSPKHIAANAAAAAQPLDDARLRTLRRLSAYLAVPAQTPILSST
jgi:D-threo-aldose 1-dehydrogenase